MAFSHPLPPHVEHLQYCPRHPDNLTKNALTLAVVPNCPASCPISDRYRQFPPFKQEINGLFNQPWLGEILFDFYAKKIPKLIVKDERVIVVKNGMLYMFDTHKGLSKMQPIISELVALEVMCNQTIVLNAQGEIYNLSLPKQPFLPEMKGIPVAVLKVALYTSYLLVLTVDGDLFEKSINLPLRSIPLPGHAPAKAISLGSAKATSEYNMIVQLTNGPVLAKGNNSSGQLACGDTQPRNQWTPILLPEGKTSDQIEKIEMGEHHTVLQFKTGEIFTCGDNKNGQLGCGDMRQNSSSWVQVQGLPASIHLSISVGSTHTIALGTDGSLWGWGDNSWCQLAPGNERLYVHAIPIARAYWGHIVAAFADPLATSFLFEKGEVSAVFQTYGSQKNSPKHFAVIMDLNAIEAKQSRKAATFPPSSAFTASGAGGPSLLPPGTSAGPVTSGAPTPPSASAASDSVVSRHPTPGALARSSAACPPPEPEHRPKIPCRNCETLTAKRCPSCKEVAYCCKDCQQADWAEHKKASPACREVPKKN